MPLPSNNIDVQAQQQQQQQQQQAAINKRYNSTTRCINNREGRLGKIKLLG